MHDRAILTNNDDEFDDLSISFRAVIKPRAARFAQKRSIAFDSYKQNELLG